MIRKEFPKGFFEKPRKQAVAKYEIRPCYGGWAYCNGNCSNCKHLNYSDRTEESEWKQSSISTNTNT